MMSNGQLEKPLLLHWVVVVASSLSVLMCLVLAHVLGVQIQWEVDASTRELVRSVLYVVAIILLPLTSLVRHILLRLNHTMPSRRSAANRYFVTILITQAMIEPIAVFGLLMFVLGDDFNSLYIFSIMAGLGIYFHRPAPQEYADIYDSVQRMKESSEL